MSERVKEIVVFIVNAMRSNIDDTIQGRFESLSQKLEEEGYTATEIDSAFSWLMENFNNEPIGEIIGDPSYRKQPAKSWDDLDRSILTPAAYNYVIQLRELDIIGETEVERIIEKALMHGKNGISISEIKALIASLIFNPAEASETSFFIFKKSYQVH